MKIRMSGKEIDLFMAFLSPARSYFEFGMGGSTVVAAGIVPGKVYAVESDRAWIAKVAALIEETDHERRLIHVDIGPTGAWGVPLTDEGRARYPDYSGAIAACGCDDFDLCLVDGRFRVACFLQAIRHLRPDAVIGIHDYRSRGIYHVAETFGRVVAEADDLTFFVRRPDLDGVALQKALDAHLYEPRH